MLVSFSSSIIIVVINGAVHAAPAGSPLLDAIRVNGIGKVSGDDQLISVTAEQFGKEDAAACGEITEIIGGFSGEGKKTLQIT